MSGTGFFLPMDDGAEIYVHKWDKVPQPKAVLQLAHGMAEHILRYDSFAQACNRQGIIVLGSDHRGHGRTAEKSGQQGYFAPEKGFDRVVQDLFTLNRRIQTEFPQIPIFLMGHSMGSFLTRRYLQIYGNSIAGAILMGSGGDPGLAAVLGKLIARLEMKRDPQKPSPLLDWLAFGGFNRGIKNPASKFSWLSRDSAQVGLYEQDPLCGFVCSSGFFYDLFTGLAQIHDDSLFRDIPPKLPLLVLSGDQDPVGKNGKAIKEFVAQYRKHGITEIETILYPGARHELLNETNKSEVITDICRWLKEQLAKEA